MGIRQPAHQRFGGEVAAYKHGLALALPDAAMTRPEGSQRAVQTLNVEGVEKLAKLLAA